MVSPEAIEKSFEDIGILQKEVKLLKKNLNRVLGDVENINLVGFQAQINQIDAKVDKLQGAYNELAGEQFMWLQRKISEFIIAYTISFLNQILKNKKTKDAIEQLTLSSIAIFHEIEFSENPLYDAIKFYNNSMDLAEKHGIKILKLDNP